jgi:hypothetical protein
MFENATGSASGRGNISCEIVELHLTYTVIGLLLKYMHVLVQSSVVTPAVVSMY